MLKLTLPYPPSGNSYKRHYCTEDRTHKISAYLTDETKMFKEEAGWMAKMAYKEPLQGPLVAVIRIYRPHLKGDIDNLQKVLLDALQGIVYRNDSQLEETHVYVKLDRLNPRVEVEIKEVEG